jgi:hypothetical protein
VGGFLFIVSRDLMPRLESLSAGLQIVILQCIADHWEAAFTNALVAQVYDFFLTLPPKLQRSNGSQDRCLTFWVIAEATLCALLNLSRGLPEMASNLLGRISNQNGARATRLKTSTDEIKSWSKRLKDECVEGQNATSTFPRIAHELKTFPHDEICWRDQLRMVTLILSNCAQFCTTLRMDNLLNPESIPSPSWSRYLSDW